MCNPKIKAAIERYREKIEQRTLVTFDDITNLLLEIANNHKSENPEASIKAISEYNDMLGYRAPQRSVTTNINVSADLEEIRKKYEREY